MTATQPKPKELVLKYDQLYTLLNWINVPLHSEQARARNRVTKLINPHYDQFQADRILLLKKYAELDESGELKKNGQNEAIFETPEKEAALEADFVTLASYKVHFDLEGSQRADWAVVRDTFAKTQVHMDVKTTAFFEDVLTAFEAI